MKRIDIKIRNQKLINDYFENPDLRVKSLAQKYQISISSAGRILTKHFMEKKSLRNVSIN